MNTKKIYTFSMIFGMIWLSVACSDFLQESSQNQAYVDNVNDLNELLIGEGYLPGGYTIDTANAKAPYYWSSTGVSTMPSYFSYIHLMDDDASEYLIGKMGTSEGSYIRLKAANLHHWQPDPFIDSSNKIFDDLNWTECWKRIAAMNSIIYQVREMRGNEDDLAMCDKVEGEARFLRAQYYFWMANVYGLPYTKETASTDPCIPLKTTEVIEDRYFERATAEKVYGQMVEDLVHSVVLLRGVKQDKKYRANQAAAFTLLSRVYLYMEKYEEAIACADSVLMGDYGLLDYNNHIMGSSTVFVNSPEVIFTHGPNMLAVLHAPYYFNSVTANGCSAYSSSEDLMECFDAKDLRLKAFFLLRPAPATEYRCLKTLTLGEEVSDHFAIRLPETYLNRAEALALLGREAEAQAAVDVLRRNRFASADFKATTASGEELVNFIRNERRRELCFEGHRWFDLRRYAVNSVYPFTKTIEHVSLAQTDGADAYVEGTYVLKPYPEDRGAYVLPIPASAIDFNKEYLTNEVRAPREMIIK